MSMCMYLHFLKRCYIQSFLSKFFFIKVPEVKMIWGHTH